jgi:hypothetical protein
MTSLADRPSLLEISEQGLTAMLEGHARFVAEINVALDAAVSAALAAEPSLRDELLRVDELARRIESTYQGRFGHRLVRHGSAQSLGMRDPSLAYWCEEARDLIHSMQTERRPFTQSARLRQQGEMARRCDGVLSRRPLSEMRALTSAFATFRATALPAAEEAFAARIPALRAQLDELPTPPPVVGYLGPGATDDLDLAALMGVGRLALVAGFAVLRPLVLTVHEPTGAMSQPVQLPVQTGPFAIPLLLDLDRDGGLVTDHKATADNVMLRLLGLLPAGRVKATVIDALGLGEAAGHLFGLGEAAEHIIGQKVLTTHREITDALSEIEDHITRVTQKYLQGEYASLTEYNRAAGEVSEPYRVLLIYDLPSAFARPDGQLDAEAIARFGKIVRAGARCGVFVLAVAEYGRLGGFEEAVLSLPWLWQRRPSAALSRMAFGGLPAPELGVRIERPAPRLTAEQLSTARHGGPLFVAGAAAEWVLNPDEPADPDVRTAILGAVERGVLTADDVRVTTAHVARLARAKLDDEVRRHARAPERLPLPDDPASWWGGSSLDAIAATFARVGARGIGELRFDGRTMSGALIGGQPGSGKSVLLHAVIGALAMRYSPAELELYLVDFKEGVEFKVYAAEGLPHARVVAVESDREFGLSVLQSLDAEIARRGALFRHGSGEEVSLGSYRERTGAPMARIVLIVDEFHMLFDRDDKIASAAADVLDRIVRQGRAFGVHTILASQTIAGVSGLGRHTLNQLPIRVALRCSDADSRLLLADDNADARLLTRSGEGILNTAQGVRDANTRFQAAYSSPEERIALVRALRERADATGHPRRPVVFEGRAAIAPEAFPLPELLLQEGPTTLSVPVGAPLTLDGPVAATLRREPAGNLLVIGDEELGTAMTRVIATLLTRLDADLEVFDYGGIDGPVAELAERLAAHGVKTYRRRAAEERLTALAELVDQRHRLGEHRERAVVCVLASLHRARDLDGYNEASERLEHILREGPDVGVHVIAWCDKPVTLGRRLAQSAVREFGLRLLGPMSKEDSYALVDSDAAATLTATQVLLDDHERAVTTRARRFETPSDAWIAACLGGA